MRTAPRLILAALVLHLLLIQPNHPAAMTWGALAVPPLELPVILLGLLVLPPGAGGRAVRAALVAVLLGIAILKAADSVMFTAFGRGFNPVGDLALIEAGLRLSAGTIGPLWTVAAGTGALAAVVLIGGLLWWATGAWSRVRVGRRTGRTAAVAAALCAGLATAEVGQAMGRWTLPVTVPGAAFTARVGVERIAMARETLADLRAFQRAAATDPQAGRDGLLSAIDRDVLVIFVESYGRASLDTPLYAATHRATLAEAEARLAGLGLSMRSGLLTAPTRGGQSWLSHATFANGLWIADQISYSAALASGRHTLFHLAADAGFHTAAVMPQITLDWPDSAVMGFETVLAARDLGYRGPSFNWVTMPDQYTLAALDRRLRARPDDRPLFAQVALVSSHAPWVPVPDLVAWDAIGDGRIFAAMASAGDPPAVVWRDPDRVRAQYRKAVDYALRVVFDYAARHAEDPPLIVVVGDHQAARFVALDERPDVPIHVIGPPVLVARTEAWGWTEGLLPAPDATPRPMDRMRDLIVEAFSTPRAGERGGWSMDRRPRADHFSLASGPAARSLPPKIVRISRCPDR
ncbi:sulfatase-like hydrolase/transferase [Roseospira navarrensis]|uniref:Sulfatase-like hydrolase/transferase n=1 Tax=Roseospira navarrensis TaxID=140058 RepID=A0A7X2D2H5_9PROT|nr:sulfatase-like hydrolase/transferase [Roseospira navarrensis]MQX35706.1 sulfatase-like hydrolase/transferase [Roseospira navarrensis]